MDEQSVEKASEFIEDLRDEIEVREAYVFGSRARDDYEKDSDIDLLVVSEDFEGKPPHKRAKMFYKKWEYPPDLEVKCYTPEEFDQRLEKVSLARTARKEGIAVA